MLVRVSHKEIVHNTTSLFLYLSSIVWYSIHSFGKHIVVITCQAVHFEF